MSLLAKPAKELLSDLASGQLTAAALMRATLDRIEVANGHVNAIVALRDADDLMREAEAADAAETRGPLHGLPIAVKDLVNVRGIVSTQGSPILKDFVPKKDDLLAQRMRDSGAILIGKTNVPEFGLGSHSFNPVYGATSNPYDPTRSCGGSSGGAAVALATGMTALADGSDMMGSLRNPAAWNNVYGFRPSIGLVPSEPVGEAYFKQLATLGPMARNPEDLALFLDVLSGPDPRVPGCHAADPMMPLPPVDCAGLRIGWLGDWGGAYPMEEGVLEQCETALEALRGLGCTVENVAPPFDPEKIWESWIILRSWAVAGSLKALQGQRAQLKDSAQWELDRGLNMGAMEVMRASEIRSDWFRACAALFTQYDALILPSAQVWPFPGELPYPTEVAGQTMDTYHRWMDVMVPVSLLGLPALAAPAGFGAAGLPMGAQIFGPLGADRKLLAIGAAYHAATRWPENRPPPG